MILYYYGPFISEKLCSVWASQCLKSSCGSKAFQVKHIYCRSWKRETILFSECTVQSLCHWACGVFWRFTAIKKNTHLYMNIVEFGHSLVDHKWTLVMLDCILFFLHFYLDWVLNVIAPLSLIIYIYIIYIRKGCICYCKPLAFRWTQPPPCPILRVYNYSA